MLYTTNNIDFDINTIGHQNNLCMADLLLQHFHVYKSLKTNKLKENYELNSFLGSLEVQNMHGYYGISYYF